MASTVQQEIQAHTNDKIAAFRSGNGALDINWRSFGPHLLGIALCTFGGSRLQHEYIGYWALLVAFVPLFLVYAVPIRVHNRRLRQMGLD